LKAIFIILFYLLIQPVFGQNELIVQVKSADDREPLIGANVYFDSLQIGASTDTNGQAQIKNKTLPFTAKNKLNTTISYDQECSLCTGLEAFYTGEQLLQDGGQGCS
jgi:hypothetical protein